MKREPEPDCEREVEQGDGREHTTARRVDQQGSSEESRATALRDQSLSSGSLSRPAQQSASFGDGGALVEEVGADQVLAQAGPEERFLIGDALGLDLGPDREDVHPERSREVAHVQVVVQWSGCQQQTSVLEIQLPA